MLSKFLPLAFIASAFAADQLQITAPGPDVWWVAGNENVIAWEPCPGLSGISGFNVVIGNKNQTVLAGNFSAIANQQYTDCSHLYIPPDFLKIAPGYILYLTDPVNINNIITSTDFDIKDINSAGYPSTTREPVTISTSASGTSSGSPSQTASSNQPARTSAATTITISVTVALMGVVNAILEGIF